jgi:3-deoxy-7-phosphoheptulonate synthase
MIIVMSPGASPEQIEHVVNLIRDMGLMDHVIKGTDRTVIAAIGDKRLADKTQLEQAPMVEKIVPILSPFKMASKEIKREPTQIEFGPAGEVIGGKRVVIFAGPCSVESKEQLIQTAEAIKATGASAIRGGAFKPRTNPYAFQGLGEEGLKILAAAREKTGLAVVTEVMCEEEVLLVAKYADILQIGARNMHNFRLLSAVGRQDKPVLLKRGFSASLEEFLLAAEYVIAAGNPNVILCERGIRTFEDYCRNTLCLSIIPAVKRLSHLPIMIDPSHGTGHAYMVPDMCKAAVAAGADGLIIEVHHDPEHALTDGAQSITPAQYAELVPQLAGIAKAIGRTL